MGVKKICLVTPDVMGPARNGGIGTHVYNLARLLSARHEVSILYTEPVMNLSPSHWRKYYARLGICFEWLGRTGGGYAGLDLHRDISVAVYEHFKNRELDVIHFQDWKANGFHCLRAKKVLGRFNRTLLTVTMHSSTEWIDEGMRQWPAGPLAQAKLAWMERYCHAHCDLLISPSQYMFDWAGAAGWELAENRTVMPNCFLEDNNRHLAERPTPDRGHLAFFGRLETRKGLEIFGRAVESLTGEDYEGLKKISFIGMHGTVGDESSRSYLKRLARRLKPLEVSVVSELDSSAALEYLRNCGAIAILPSLADNFPYTAVECVEMKIPFLASNVGGFPEIAAGEVLFDPSPLSLAAKIKEIPAINFTELRHPYQARAAERMWLDFHERDFAAASPGPPPARPLVSLCVAHYNHGRYLGSLLKSIDENAYENYEVIIIDDGSTDEFSQSVFSELETKFASSHRRFYRTENQGPGAARNLAAAEAQGEYLLFMDADNQARPNMIKTMIEAAQQSGADCLTCHYYGFSGDAPPDEKAGPDYIQIPYGACLEAGICENVFGDTNFIIKKSVFERLGGFFESKSVAAEDHEFLARLCLNGYQLEVIPVPLFWYRDNPGSLNKTTNPNSNQRRIVATYSAGHPLFVKMIFQNILLPYHQAAGRQLELLNMLRPAVARLLPPGSCWRRAAKNIYLFLKGYL